MFKKILIAYFIVLLPLQSCDRGKSGMSNNEEITLPPNLQGAPKEIQETFRRDAKQCGKMRELEDVSVVKVYTDGDDQYKLNIQGFLQKGSIRERVKVICSVTIIGDSQVVIKASLPTK